ncbi:hypothetical protein GGR54DRAFT_436710 [Hypoxylon sp. NC1633]|nr:hypothetical protein GGR54DRAFT_436710 [Hypoxylon sp. NC1633]
MMAPSSEAIEKDLRDGVRAVIEERGWEEVTVNNVRQHVEEEGGLDKGFFKAPEWEARSKNIIKAFVKQLLAEDEGVTSPAKDRTKSKGGVKRQSSEEPTLTPKRQKKVSQAAPSKKAKSKKQEPETESELSDLNDSSDFEEPPKKATTTKAAKKEDSDSELSDLDSTEDEPKKTKPQKLASRLMSKKEETESEPSDLDDSEEEPKKKAKAPKKAEPRRKSKNGFRKGEKTSVLDGATASKKRKRAAPAKKRNSKSAKVETDSEVDPVAQKDEATESGDEERSPTGLDVKGTAKAEESDKDAKAKVTNSVDNKTAKVDDSSSELSSVLDEPPPRKRKSKEPRAASKPKQTKELTGDEAEIKKLQGQLVKCGIRKIWGFELKKYGDDSKAKLRHLRGMLRDAGMDGRFSEIKAKEIKERRELMADLEAVTEMNRNWGSGGGRASRSKAVTKSLKESENEADDKGEESNESREGNDSKANTRVSKRMADLAFLGSESESD